MKENMMKLFALGAAIWIAWGGIWPGQACAAALFTATPSQIPAGEGTAKEPGKNREPSLSLFVEDYWLSPIGKPKDRLDTLKKNETARLTITVAGSVFPEEELKKGDLSIGRIRDGYRTDSAPVIKMLSGKNEPVEFQVTFPKITYTGGDSEFHFQVRRKGKGEKPVSLGVKIAETEWAPESSAGKEKGGKGDSSQPLIQIQRSGNFTPLEPGKTAVFSMRISNTSRHTDVEDLTMAVSPSPPLYLAQDTNVTVLGKLKAGQSQEVSVVLQAGMDLSGLSQMMDVELRYSYENEEQPVQGTLSQKMMIPVAKGQLAGQPLIRITQVGQRTPVKPGQAFQRVLRLENMSETKVGNVILTLEPNDQIVLLDSSDTYLAGSLEPGQWTEITVQLKAAPELSSLPSQLLGATVKFDYDMGKGVSQGSFSEKLVIPAEGGKSRFSALTPNLIVKNYSYGGSAQAGQVFELEMEIANTSQEIAAENILMSLNTGEGLSINDASNTFYIPSLGPGASVGRTVKIQALFQSKLQSPKVEITFKYEYLDNKERKQNSVSETIAIPVYQPDRLEIRSPSFPDGVRVQEECAVSLPYLNKGRGQLFNLEAVLEGEIPVLERQVTLGNLDPGKGGTIDFIVTPETAGEFQGQVRILYEDEAMNQKEMVVPLAFQVEEGAGEEIPLPPLEEEGERKGIARRFLLPAGILMVSGGCAAFFLGQRRRKTEPEEKNFEIDDLWESWDDHEGKEEAGDEKP